MYAAVISVLCLISGLYILFKKRPLHWIPGPKPYPLVGNVLQLEPDKPHISLHEFGQTYGEVFKVFMFGKPVVVFSDPDSIHAVLLTSSNSFAGRPSTFRLEFFTNNQSGILFTDWNEKVRGRRKVTHAYLKQFGTGIKRLEDVAMTAIDDMLQDIQGHMGEPVEMRDFLFRCTSNMITILLVGKILPNEKSIELKVVLDDFVNLLSSSVTGELLDQFPILQYICRGYMQRMRCVRSFVMSIMEDWLSKDGNEGYVSYLKALPEEQKRLYCVETTESQVMVLWDLLAAGSFTTQSTMSSLVNILAQMPGIQLKLREEVLHVIGSSRPPTMEDRHNMPYMQATLHEINRFTSVSTFGAPRKVLKDITINGTLIPQGTQVLTNFWSLHHNEKLFSDPYTFKPERYLDEDGQLVPADHKNRKNLFPFGAGARVCVGEVFASQRMFLIMARLLQKFEIHPETTIEVQPSMDPRDMSLGVALNPPPFKVRLVPLK